MHFVIGGARRVDSKPSRERPTVLIRPFAPLNNSLDQCLDWNNDNLAEHLGRKKRFGRKTLRSSLAKNHKNLDKKDIKIRLERQKNDDYSTIKTDILIEISLFDVFSGCKLAKISPNWFTLLTSPFLETLDREILTTADGATATATSLTANKFCCKDTNTLFDEKSFAFREDFPPKIYSQSAFFRNIPGGFSPKISFLVGDFPKKFNFPNNSTPNI
uniref:Uncharacterized protein n=1 Tax=Romanomermis culicivorax TaxID=13658 RepID=A0A915KBT0_ROMCU